MIQIRLIRKVHHLSPKEKELKLVLDTNLKKLLRYEEFNWGQRASEKDLLEGGGNTQYFQIKASRRKKKNHIIVLLKDGVEFKGHDDLVKHITDFYKDLFGPTEIIYIKLEYHICKKFTGEDRAFLTKNFTLEEIKEVVFGMKHYTAVGYDGLPIEFYQFFWYYTKFDL